MSSREEKLNYLATYIKNNHVGWRNAISMKLIAAAAGLTSSLLKADRHNPKAGYIPELRKRGVPILSCNKGYYYPHPVGHPERDEDFAKHKSRVRGQAMGNLYAVAEAKRAPRYAGELSLFDD